MDEVIPVVLGALLGVSIWLTGPRRARFALGVGAVAVIGFLATVFSEEYIESWLYLVIDIVEAAAGLGLGFLATAQWRSRSGVEGFRPGCQLVASVGVLTARQK